MSEDKEDITNGIKIADIIENDDGTATLIIEYEDDFKEWFKKKQGLKRWSDKRFEKVVMEAIQDMIDRELNESR